MSNAMSVPHILIVDDEADLADEILDYMTNRHLNAQAVTSAQDALHKLDADQSISVLLSDIRMPGLNGLDLANAALSRRTDEHPLEVVILTGHGTVDDAAKAVRAGAIDFLQKPVGLATLEQAVRRAGAVAEERRHQWQELRTLRAQSNGVELREPHTTANDNSEALLTLLNHELRTPLGPIVGMADIIEHHLEALSPDQIRAFAADIGSGGKRLERAIRRISELTALVAGTMPVKLSPCPVSTIVDAAEQACSQGLTDRVQRLTISQDPNVVCITDRRLLSAAIAELINNAGRHSADGSAIALNATVSGDRISFAVSDKGRGMAPDEIDQALRIFQQIDMSSKRQVDGLGIGLYIAHRTATLLGGMLTIASTPGRGTVATLRIPLGR
jgi:signal transduction histidine kinase